VATAGDIVYAGELEALMSIAAARGWPLRTFSARSFLLGLQARDDRWWYLLVDCESYKATPAAWHWSTPEGTDLDSAKVTPKGKGGYFHGSGKICAPWNRLSYKVVDPAAPHGDWQLANWISNPKNGGCRTLSAMALRMHVELSSERYQERKAA
jgi:hypothetical protein